MDFISISGVDLYRVLSTTRRSEDPESHGQHGYNGDLTGPVDRKVVERRHQIGAKDDGKGFSFIGSKTVS